MLLRALVVLLVILNLGVAAWWSLRGAPVDVAVTDTAPPTLQLVGEGAAEGPAGPGSNPAQGTGQGEHIAADDTSAAVTIAASALVDAAPRPADPPQCVALGPFADTTARDAVLQGIAPGVVRIARREVEDAPRGWRVWMAPLADRAAAGGMVARLLEAGFNDYYIIGDGAEANAIALGRFGSEAAARARAQALRTAGFEADVAPIGNPQLRHWIDALLADGDTPASLRERAGAQRVESRDCNARWDAG